MKQGNNSFKNNLIIGLRFVFCALPGFFIFLISSVYLTLSLSGHKTMAPNPVIAGFLLPVGLLLTLYGLNKWGQWKHLISIGLIPVVFFLVLALLTVFPVGKGGLLIAAVIAIPLLIIINRQISKHYDQHEKNRKAQYS